MLYTTVALSVLLSFISSEFLGILTGGMISAGYLAYFFSEPTRIAATILLGVVICLLMKALRHVIILYGRRRFMLSVILSLATVYLVQKSYYYLANVPVDVRVIGYIIPGLIANDMEKQGIIKTTLAVVAVTILVRLFSLLGA